MKKFLSIALVAGMLVITSCDSKSKTETIPNVVDSIKIINTDIKESKIEVKEELKKQVEKKVSQVKEEQPKVESKKVEEVPQEIGASPDAVYSLDDNDTESTPKFPDGEKAMKKLLKKALRKGQKGEKAKFRASLVIKADGTVGRVQFTECGYNDDYKPEIIEALRALPAFTPGTKDGKAVDSWYYLDYKR